jgi:hypothetical protein
MTSKVLRHLLSYATADKALEIDSGANKLQKKKKY